MPRPCQENLDRRAWASAHARRCLAEQLLAQPILRKVHARQLRRALETGRPEAIAEALPALEAEVARCQAITRRARLHPAT